MEKIKYYIHFIEDKAGDLLAGNPFMWIFLFMTLESMFIPFPSEIIMIPAGYYAAGTANPEITLAIVIVLWVAGSIFWALINYYIAVYGGEKISKKLLWEDKHNIAVKYFKERGDVTTFVCRLIPVVRQVISFPAGLFRMDIRKFILYTGAGAFIWVSFLAWVWYYFGNNPELIEQYKIEFIIGGVFLLVIAIIGKIYFIKKLKKWWKKWS